MIGTRWNTDWRMKALPFTTINSSGQCSYFCWHYTNPPVNLLFSTFIHPLFINATMSCLSCFTWGSNSFLVWKEQPIVFQQRTIRISCQPLLTHLQTGCWNTIICSGCVIDVDWTIETTLLLLDLKYCSYFMLGFMLLYLLTPKRSNKEFNQHMLLDL